MMNKYQNKNHVEQADQHWPALDGVRGIAVLLVVLVHLHLLGLGWIGVQLFFVLSGFLITRLLLLDAQSEASFAGYLKAFYVRRALRIFPIFYLYVAVLAISAWTFGAMAPIRGELPFVATYTANFFMTTTHEQLNSPANWMVAHLWSLCVEEHFYLLWPLCVYFLGRRGMFQLAGVLLLAGPLIRLATALMWPNLSFENLTSNIPRVVYLLSSSHLDAFATGALLNLVPKLKLPKHAVLMFLGVLAFAYLLGTAGHGWGVARADRIPPLALGYPIHMPSAWQFVWGYSVINFVSAALILLALNHASSQRLFSWGWLRFTGKISYGMYIFHMPLIAVMIRGSKAAGWPMTELHQVLIVAPFYFAILYTVSYLSFRYFETPFLKLKQRLAPHRDSL